MARRGLDWSGEAGAEGDFAVPGDDPEVFSPVGRPLKEHAHGTVLEHATAPPCEACAFRQARLDAGLTQAGAARLLGLSLRTAHRWEAVITLPPLAQARRAAATERLPRVAAWAAGCAEAEAAGQPLPAHPDDEAFDVRAGWDRLRAAMGWK